MPFHRLLGVLIWVVVLSTCIPSCWALTIDADQQWDYANRLLEEQQYRRAAEEYQRFSFFFSDHPRQRDALYKSGKVFLLAGDPSTALNIFKSIINEPTPDKIVIDAHFMLVECYLKLNAPTQAVVQLHNIIALTDNVSIKDRAYHRMGWLHIGFTDWAAARRSLSHISTANRLHYRTDEVSALLEDTAAIPRKNPTLAGTLSIIPGAGQLYCGRYEDALIAFIVNIGLFLSASEAFEQDQPALGGLLGFIGLGFYSGNIYGAISDAHKFNRNQQGHYADQLKSYQVREAALPPDASGKTLFFSLHLPF